MFTAEQTYTYLCVRQGMVDLTFPVQSCQEFHLPRPTRPHLEKALQRNDGTDETPVGLCRSIVLESTDIASDAYRQMNWIKPAWTRLEVAHSRVIWACQGGILIHWTLSFSLLIAGMKLLLLPTDETHIAKDSSQSRCMQIKVTSSRRYLIDAVAC